MNIGFFTDSYFPGIDGVTYTIQAWRDRLESRGHDVYVVYPESSHEPDEREIPVPSLPNPFYRQYRLPTYRRLSTLPDLDIVHCHGPASTGLMGLRYAKRYGARSVYTHHTPVEDYFVQGLKSERLASLAGRAYVGYENRLLKAFDCVTASTSRIRRDVEPYQLPVGIEMDRFRPREGARVAALATDGGPTAPDASVVGYSGRMTHKKNVDEILRLAERLPEVRFELVGEGPVRAELEADAPENVRFHDFLPREELPGFYAALDVFVTASTCDTLGLSTLEANACGTPVAAAGVAPFDETIGPENGARFAFGDLDDMERAVRDCLDGDRDTRSAVKRFSVEQTIDELESIYGVTA
ncbi:glycosyl transferase group 1 [Halorubrum californiense DSM 19288]|uniref:Glycosyl transferase group 1 n=1 Tax=Halorubrum californiense DSM 19288 TaxID=1227465 RepID=M0ED39_9EURY|nr:MULTISPECIES: glycosyltransferase [Halorubrum]ELZ44797.1 glycosyl transferase group 1 [Halorubrum californiense DSM 19288]TKX71831.1 glycosyltransferase [Halorubrum sp. GN11GM_10-3_MGM]